MKNSDVLRSLRYLLAINDKEMARIANTAGPNVNGSLMEKYLKNEEDKDFIECPSMVLSQFLNGLIYLKRGKDESRPALLATNKVTNNLVLKKLRVAFQLKDEDMIQVFQRGGQEITKSELTALFRAEDHPKYCECGDQFLRKFLAGCSK